MAALDNGASTTAVANVNSNFQLEVHTPTIEEDAGFVQISSEVDAGTVTGARLVRRLMASECHGLRISNDAQYLIPSFNTASLATSIWKTIVTGMTVVQSGGLLVLNAASSTTLTDNAIVCSYRSIPFDSFYELHMSGIAQVSHVTSIASGSVLTQFGFSPQSVLDAAGASSIDGVYASISIDTGTPSISLFYSRDGIVLQSATPSLASIGIAAAVSFQYDLFVTKNIIELYVNHECVCTLNMTTNAASAPPPPFSEASAFFRVCNPGSPTSAVQGSFGNTTVASTALFKNSRDWPSFQAGQGAMAYQGQPSQTMGSIANYANNANPTPAVPTNTTAALGSGLGGQFWETDTLALGTDGIICSFQVPAGSPTVPGQTLFITGVKVDSYIQTILVTAAYIAQWSLAFGHVTVNLTAVEAAGTKAPRRIALGIQKVTTLAALTALGGPSMTFSSPIAVYPNEFIQVVKKKVGTTTAASGTIAHMITFTGYFE